MFLRAERLARFARRRGSSLLAAAIVGGCFLPPAPAGGQTSRPVPVADEIFAGSELENYLRALHGLDSTRTYPWSIRAFSPSEVSRRLAPPDSAHPWEAQVSFGPADDRELQMSWIRPRLGLTYNSDFPYGGNDGAVWAGRGWTGAAQAGISVGYGPLSLVLAPEFFWAQNAEVDLVPNGQEGPLAYGSRQYPTYIDLPQRFGSESYSRVDPGQSTLRLDWGVGSAGVSTANQFWGPAREYPILLGNNAAGFPHAFFGTARPVAVGVGRLHGRMVVGRLDQSEYSSIAEEDGRRLMSGLIAVFTPRGIQGLELGLARFFHSTWPQDGVGLGELSRPFEGLFKSSLFERLTGDPDRDADNQLASVFVRWAPPGTGFEIYGEFGREDHPWDLRQFVLLPDDVSGYMLGFQKSWLRADRSLVVVRGETLNTGVSHLTRADPLRGQPPMYIHVVHHQGHTQRGQLLASPAGLGARGSVLATDYYHRRGRWTVSWERTEQSPRWDQHGARVGSAPDVVHALGVESLLFRQRMDVLFALDGVYNLNRHGEPNDVFAVRARLGLRAAF